MSSKYWETIWHPFRAIEVHYNEDGWKRLSEGRLKAWPSFGEVRIDKDFDWNIDSMKYDNILINNKEQKDLSFLQKSFEKKLLKIKSIQQKHVDNILNDLTLN